MPTTAPAPSRATEALALRGTSVRISDKTTWVMVALTFPGGVTGWGEATAFGHEPELARLIGGLAASISAEPAHDLADVLARLRQSDMALPRRSLASALEQAWLDGLARQAEVPLCHLLGGAERRQVPFYANINRGIADRSPEGFAARARQVCQSTGATAVKIAPFDGFHHARNGASEATALLDSGLARVAAVREALGPDRRLMVDCHGRFDPFTARSILRELAAQDVFWVEEPCDMSRLDAAEQRSLRGAANDSGLRVAGAETVIDFASFAALIDAGGHDVVLPDLRMTGLLRGMAMLELAAARQIGVSLHNPVGPVLDAVSTQVAMAAPAFLVLERQVGETPLFDGLRGGPVATTEAGQLCPGTAPGIGFRPAQESLRDLEAGAASPVPLSHLGMTGAGPDA